MSLKGSFPSTNILGVTNSQCVAQSREYFSRLRRRCNELLSVSFPASSILSELVCHYNVLKRYHGMPFQSPEASYHFLTLSSVGEHNKNTKRKTPDTSPNFWVPSIFRWVLASFLGGLLSFIVHFLKGVDENRVETTAERNRSLGRASQRLI